MNPYIEEFQRYRSILLRSLDQVTEEDFFRRSSSEDNSIAILVKHIAGNLRSRFTDFRTSDGEKTWRDRDGEFELGGETMAELRDALEESWTILQENVQSVGPADRVEIVTIRGVEHTIEEALARALAHLSYHVGQVTLLAKQSAGVNWQTLSIPKGGSDAYNRDPNLEKAVAAVGREGVAHLRVARPSDDLVAVMEFYRDGLGFDVLSQFRDHEGFDGVMLGHPGAAYHLEFTHRHGHAAGRAPTKDNLLVLYVPDQAEWSRAVRRLEDLGHRPVRAFNPYWDRDGRTFEDPDGYRVVLQNARWPTGPPGATDAEDATDERRIG